MTDSMAIVRSTNSKSITFEKIILMVSRAYHTKYQRTFEKSLEFLEAFQVHRRKIAFPLSIPELKFDQYEP